MRTSAKPPEKVAVLGENKLSNVRIVRRYEFYITEENFICLDGKNVRVISP